MKRNRGQGLVEYALFLALVAVVSIAMLAVLGQVLRPLLDRLEDLLRFIVR